METVTADKPIEASADNEVTATSEAVAPQTDVEPAKTFDEDYVKSLRQEAAKYRTQAKDLAEKAKAYDEYLDSQKSEQEKLADQLKQAEEGRAEVERELLRMKVASSKNLPGTLVERLRGETVEELEADADNMLEELQQQFVKKNAPTPNQTGAGIVGDEASPSIDTFLDILRKRG